MEGLLPLSWALKVGCIHNWCYGATGGAGKLAMDVGSSYRAWPCARVGTSFPFGVAQVACDEGQLGEGACCVT
jgi:hypothetical protein